MMNQEEILNEEKLPTEELETKKPESFEDNVFSKESLQTFGQEYIKNVEENSYLGKNDLEIFIEEHPEIGLNEVKEIEELEKEINEVKEETVNQIKEEMESAAQSSDKLDLRLFSRRYFNDFRKEIFGQIMQLRSLKKKQTLNIEKYIQEIDQKKAEKETLEKSVNDTENVILLAGNDIKNLEIEILELKNNLNDKKNNFFSKINQFINRKKINNDVVRKEEILNKIIENENLLEQLNNKKTSLSERSSEKINNLKKSIKDIEDEITEQYKMIQEAENIINDNSRVGEIQDILNDFYSQVQEGKSNFESESELRDLKKNSEEFQSIFCHVIRDYVENFKQNNELVNAEQVDIIDKAQAIIGLEPTISTSTININDRKLASNDDLSDFNIKLMLKGGRILSSYAGDAGTYLNEDIYNRKSKRDRSVDRTTIQELDKEKIANSINKQKTTGDHSSLEHGWNEIVIEDPKIGGIFCEDINKLEKKINTFKNYSQDLNLPVYVFNENQLCEIVFDKETDNYHLEKKEISDFLNNEVDFSNQEKFEYVGKVIDKDFFKEKTETIQKFNKYNNGRALFHLFKNNDEGNISTLSTSSKPNDFDDKEFLSFPRADDNFFVVKKDLTQSITGKNGYLNQNDYLKESGAVSYFSRENYLKKEKEETGVDYYLRLATLYLNNLQENISKETDLIKIKYFKKEKNETTIQLFGLYNECLKNGSPDQAAQAKKIIDDFEAFDYCDKFVTERVDDEGKFKKTKEDISFFIKKRLESLKNKESSV